MFLSFSQYVPNKVFAYLSIVPKALCSVSAYPAFLPSFQ